MAGSLTAGTVLSAVDPGPKVLTLPSATTMRFVILMAAMLATGLFLGVVVFAAMHGQAFAQVAVSCLGSAGAVDAGCAAGEREYALYAVAGPLVIALGAMVVVMAAPSVVVRRRSLRSPDPRLAAAMARTAELCARLGIRRVPTVVVGPVVMRDAFGFGRPGRPHIAIPLALALRPHTPVFETVMLHELAHVSHRDVPLAWSARSVWYVLGPLLVLPIVIYSLTGDTASLPDYLWRVGILAVVVQGAARSALRSREHAADVAAAQTAGTDAVTAVIRNLRPRTASRWRRIVAFHPSPAERLAVVNEPGRLAAVTVTDGAIVAFLALLTLPVLDSFFTAVFIRDQSGLALVASALIVGTLAGSALGPGLWRQALVGRVAPVRARTAVVLAAVAVGGIAGQLVSLAGVGLGGVAGVTHPAVVLVTAGAFTGATALTVGAGELWADAAGRVRHPTRYVAAAVGGSVVVFVVALWAGDVLQGLLDLGSWALAGLAVFSMLTTGAVALAGLVLALGAAWALFVARRGAVAPRWLSPQDRVLSSTAPGLSQTIVVGIAAGLAATTVMIFYRLHIGESGNQTETAQRFLADLWMAGCAGAAAACALALRCGRRGWGAGLLAAPIAVLVAAAGHLSLIVTLNGFLPLSVLAPIVTDDLALGFLLTIAVAALSLAFGKRVPARPLLSIVLLGVVLAIAADAEVAAGRDILIPPATTAGAVP